MTTDEHFDGEVHGLLADAFDDGVPVVNLVPGAVDGYRRHRRRARVVGAAGGTLALAGVIAAGTAVATGSPAGPHQVFTGPAAGVPAAGATTACDGSYHLFGQYNGSGVYSADQQGLTASCEYDLTALRELTGDPDLVPLTETGQQAIVTHDEPAGSTPPSSASTYIQPGFYDGRIDGSRYRISIRLSDRNELFDPACDPRSCPPNRTLADGHTATEVSSGPYDTLVIHWDQTHSVMVSAFLTERTSAAHVPFDFEKLIASPGFAQLISADVRTLDQLTHPA